MTDIPVIYEGNDRPLVPNAPIWDGPNGLVHLAGIAHLVCGPGRSFPGTVDLILYLPPGHAVPDDMLGLCVAVLDDDGVIAVHAPDLATAINAVEAITALVGGAHV